MPDSVRQEKGDTIYRQDAIEVADAVWMVTGDKNVAKVWGQLKDVPSAQKKGHWIDEETNYLCSECHRGCWVNSDYCPWCGADMRKEGEENG